MNTLYLIRHSLTEANERRLYGGSTDSPLTEQGRAVARSRRGAVPECDVYVSSGMKRADETLRFMTGRKPDMALSDLREMDFGAFEMKSYDQLKDLPEYQAWITDETGTVCCPGGENNNAFRTRVMAGGKALLSMPRDSAMVVCHGGVIVRLMEAWFPDIQRQFYEWQPGACRGYEIPVKNGQPAGFKEI